jgi:hypothetical protein
MISELRVPQQRHCSSPPRRHRHVITVQRTITSSQTCRARYLQTLNENREGESSATEQALVELTATYNEVTIGLAVVGVDGRYLRINSELRQHRDAIARFGSGLKAVLAFARPLNLSTGPIVNKA